MKVLDLACPHGHGFEGWFASEDAFQAQRSQGLVGCPLCGDTAIVKRLSAPRLNLGAAAPPGAERPADDEPQQRGRSGAMAPAHADALVAAQAAWMRRVREVLAATEDVGERFAQEARRMHYGETEERGIRGKASREETEALLDEGIVVLPLVLPAALKEPLQ